MHPFRHQNLQQKLCQHYECRFQFLQVIEDETCDSFLRHGLEWHSVECMSLTSDKSTQTQWCSDSECCIWDARSLTVVNLFGSSRI